jgi:hypothetical protein
LPELNLLVRVLSFWIDQVVAQLADGLPRLAAEGQWLALTRALQFVLWLSPGPAAAAFIQARGTVRVQGKATAAALIFVHIRSLQQCH